MSKSKIRFFKSKTEASHSEQRLRKLLSNIEELPQPLDDVVHLSTKIFPKGVIAADFHGGKFSTEMFTRMLQVADSGYNDVVIVVGDFADCAAFSPHKTGRKEDRNWEKESENLSLTLRVLADHFAHIHILPGTHTRWINLSLKSGEFTFAQMCKLYIPAELFADKRVSTSEMTWGTLDIDKEDPLVFFHAGTYLKTPLAGAERAHWRSLDYYQKRVHILSFHGHETHFALRGPDKNKRYWIEAGGLAERKRNLYPHLYLDDRYRYWSPSFVSFERLDSKLNLQLHHELN